MPDPISLTLSAPYYLAALAFGYLIGSIPFGVLITRWSGMGDVRNVGSGNIGATNVLRTGNRWAALATLLGDGGKGALAVLLAKLAGPVLPLFAGAGAFVGHLFPVWLGFKGGKGVATFFGIVLALKWPVGTLALLIWLAVAVFTKYSSLAAVVTVLAVPVLFLAFSLFELIPLVLFLAVLVIYRHRENIARLLNGTESKINLRRKS
ncbi:MAG: glycerol-3-phosphate 1-O-acyltransferase PlsY [Pseudomonadota bacterium]